MMRILYITTISSTMNAFFKPHIEMLVRKGNQVDLACNFTDMAPDQLYNDLGCQAHQIDFSRSPLSKDNIRAYGQLKRVIEKGKYDIVHCHTPNASVITRLVCRKFRKKDGLKVFYTAHGFHFYQGAPKLNWMVYYPVEKICSRITDKLITINREDYELAKNKFKAKEVHYVPGVGIDLSRFEDIQVDRNAKRREIGVPEDAFLLMSVGELSVRKNHKVIIQAMSKMADTNIHYVIVGEGPLAQQLQDFVKETNLSQRVHFAGYRTDIAELYKAADVCCFPSIHEGLPVAVMEAMACGLPVVCSRIRGNEDLIEENTGLLVEFSDVDGFACALTKMRHEDELRRNFSEANQIRIRRFAKANILEEMETIYRQSC